MCKLSYIIPIYNGQKTIVRCLDSICSQHLATYEYEVLVVDDCSTDNTREIIISFIESHPQVRLICQAENLRQGAARNRGLQEARGEYVSFVDGDDIILDGIFSAIQNTEILKPDAVYCSCIHEVSSSVETKKQIDMPEGLCLSGISFCEHFQEEGVFWYPWGFLFRREWLISLNYPFVEKRQHEDRDWVAYVLSRASSVCNSKTPMYRYVYTPSSTCRTLRYSAVFDHVASGIRHINLSEELSSTCPKMSNTLYLFGIDEIYKSLRLRNLSKFGWPDNKHIYDENHLKPLLPELRDLYRQNKLPKQLLVPIFLIPAELAILLTASPLAKMVRRINKIQTRKGLSACLK